jgi:hypothetical protein
VSEVKLDVWSVKPVTTVSSTTRIAQMTLARSGLRQPSRQPPKTKNLTALAVAHAHSLTHSLTSEPPRIAAHTTTITTTPTPTSNIRHIDAAFTGR